ncbi:MAG: hypothetical protein KME23_06340 [Goleter apudmare HA4340-LM2]|nr:hypothetical protein [Goleter apudmare HA4340-LM2]
MSFATTSGRCVTHCTHPSGAKLISSLPPVSAAFAIGNWIKTTNEC